MEVESFQDEDLLVSNLKLLLAENKINKAVKILQAYDHNNLTKLELALAAVEVYRRKNEFNKAIRYGLKIIELWPNLPNGYQRVIQDYLSINLIYKAVTLSRKAVKKFPKDAGLLMLASNAYRSKGLLRTALRYSKNLATIHSHNPAGYYLSAQLQLELGNLKIAKKFVRDLLKKNKSQLSIILARNFYRDAGLRQKAKQLSLQILRESPLLQENQTEYAMDLLMLGKVKQYINYSTKKELIKTESEINFFTNLISLDFARNIKEPLDDKWRSLAIKFKLYNHYLDPTFNKNPHFLLNDNLDLPWICVIHVGKCAGETVINSLRQAFPRLRNRILEYHVFDSHILVQKIVEMSQFQSNIEIIFCTRDPLNRWISSFNWDYHTYKLKNHQFCPPKILQFFDQYPTNKLLAKGLIDSDPGAIYFMSFHHLTFGHMAMGQSWYLNVDQCTHLPKKQTSVIRTEFVESDILCTLEKLVSKYNLGKVNTRRILISKKKQNMKHSYPKNTFTFLPDLSVSEQNIITKHIKDDFYVHNQLIDMFFDKA